MGKIINIEGLDGSGKSTQVDLLKNYLESENYKVSYIHFPIDGNTYSEKIFNYLRGKYGKPNEVNPFWIGTVFALNRKAYLSELNKLLNENDYLIIDRYVLSNIAYQQVNAPDKKMMKDYLYNLEYIGLDLPMPNISLFIDVHTDIIKERLKNRSGKDREYLKGDNDIIESNIQYLEKVRQNYLKFKTNDYPYIKIKGFYKENNKYLQKSPQRIFELILNEISNL